METLIDIMVKLMSEGLVDALVNALADEKGSRHSGR